MAVFLILQRYTQTCSHVFFDDNEGAEVLGKHTLSLFESNICDGMSSTFARSSNRGRVPYVTLYRKSIARIATDLNTAESRAHRRV